MGVDYRNVCVKYYVSKIMFGCSTCGLVAGGWLVPMFINEEAVGFSGGLTAAINLPPLCDLLVGVEGVEIGDIQ